MNYGRSNNFFGNQEDIRFKDGKNTPLQDGDELSIIPAIAGGSSIADQGFFGTETPVTVLSPQ